MPSKQLLTTLVGAVFATEVGLFAMHIASRHHQRQKRKRSSDQLYRCLVNRLSSLQSRCCYYNPTNNPQASIKLAQLYLLQVEPILKNAQKHLNEYVEKGGQDRLHEAQLALDQAHEHLAQLG